MTLTNILIGACGVLFVLIALAIAVHHEIEGRRRDREGIELMIRDIVNLPYTVYEKRTMMIDGEPHSVRRPLHHAPRHNRGALYDDLSLTRFEKDQDDGR